MRKRILYMAFAVVFAVAVLVVPFGSGVSALAEEQQYQHCVTIAGCKYYGDAFPNAVLILQFSNSSSSPITDISAIPEYGCYCVSSVNLASDVTGHLLHVFYNGFPYGYYLGFITDDVQQIYSEIYPFFYVYDNVSIPSGPVYDRYDEGYADGLGDGITQGYQIGLDDGVAVGYQDGLQDGKDQALQEFLGEGYNLLTTATLDNLHVDPGFVVTQKNVTFSKLGITSVVNNALEINAMSGDGALWYTAQIDLPTSFPGGASYFLDGYLFTATNRLDMIYIQYKDSAGNLQSVRNFVSNTPTVTQEFPLPFSVPVPVNSLFISSSAPLVLKDLEVWCVGGSSVTYDVGYNAGKDAGISEGKQIANQTVTQSSASYVKGYQDGVDQAGNYTFFNLMSSVIDVPIQAIFGSDGEGGLFNLEIFGVNLAPLFTAVLTIALIIAVVKLIL